MPKKPNKPVQQPERKRAGGPPVGSQNRLLHGHYVRKTALLALGFDGIDRRTHHGKEFASRREAVFVDLGGRESLSQIQHDLIERYMRMCVLIDSLDSWLFAQKSIVNKRKKCLIPIVRERAALEDTALRLASALGLERKARPIPDLASYMKMTADQRERFDEEHPDDEHH